MDIKKTLKQSFIVATIISLFIPAAWLLVTGTSTRTAIVEKGFLEQMAQEEKTEWLKKNTYEASFIERAISLPRIIRYNVVGYLQASLVIFVFIFTLNLVYLFNFKNNPNK